MVQDSIYYYKGIGEFKLFIQRIDDRSLCVSDALSTFREVKCLKNDFKQMTIAQLTDEPSRIAALSDALLNGMESESKFKLQYKKEEREQELIGNLAENYVIGRQNAKAKIITGHHNNDRTKQEFNYAIEVVIAPRTDIGVQHAGEIEIIGNINQTPSIDGGESYFDGSYYWIDKSGKPIKSTGIRGILQECGFSSSNYVSAAKKKVPSVLFINLNTPCPDWLGGAGKTHIDLAPYAKDIAKTVSSLAYKMPSYHGQGYGWSRESYSEQQRPANKYLEDFLIDRFHAINSDPSLKYKDPLTQSGVWYRIRPIMIQRSYRPKKSWGETRKYITGLIDKLCEELFDDTEREDLGVVAKARAMMMYDGQTYPISIETFEDLGTKGVFILVIEKEGIANIFENIAKSSGIALVHTGGRFTKDVRKFIENAKVPVATLTDYDVYGVQISAATIRKTPRIGIDMDIIDWLQNHGYPNLTSRDVEEEYSSGIRTNDEYLKHHRIELDSIAAKVGPKVFWEYIKQKIEKLREERGFDYSNIITEPEPKSLYPKSFDLLTLKLDNYLKNAVEKEWQVIENDLIVTKGLIDIGDRKEKNLGILSKTVQEDKIIQEKVIPKINELLDELPNDETNS